MRTRMLQRLVLTTGMVVLVGCAHNHLPATQVRPTPPPQPFVFYDETGDPSKRTPALSEVELREILNWVATQTPDPVWLIRVRPNVGKLRNDIVAYLVPDEVTPRVRVGRAYDIPVSKRETQISSPWEYIQVSMPGHSFDKALTKPAVPEMPFSFPHVVGPRPQESTPMTKEEVIGIADFVRLPSTYRDVIAQVGPSKEAMIRATPESPILDIIRKDNEIEVTFGYEHGPAWGYGVTVTLDRTRAGYKVVNWAKWIS